MFSAFITSADTTSDRRCARDRVACVRAAQLELVRGLLPADDRTQREAVHQALPSLVSLSLSSTQAHDANAPLLFECPSAPEYSML